MQNRLGGCGQQGYTKRSEHCGVSRDLQGGRWWHGPIHAKTRWTPTSKMDAHGGGRMPASKGGRRRPKVDASGHAQRRAAMLRGSGQSGIYKEAVSPLYLALRSQQLICLRLLQLRIDKSLHRSHFVWLSPLHSEAHLRTATLSIVVGERATLSRDDGTRFETLSKPRYVPAPRAIGWLRPRVVSICCNVLFWQNQARRVTY